MPAGERLNNIAIKVERAKDHLYNLQEEVDSYLKSNPYVIKIRNDSKTKRRIHFIESIQPTPLKISAILGDTIHNLRSALDHLAYQLVWVGTGKEPSKHVYFPIADDQEKYNTKSQKDLKGASASAIEAVDALNPYKGGNELLWKLHRLSIVDKHRVLITAGSAFRSVNVWPALKGIMREQAKSTPFLSQVEIPELGLFLRPKHRKFPLKQDDVLFIENAPADYSSYEQPQFRFEVAFGEEGVVNGEPIIKTVETMINHVEDIIPKFEAYLQ